jgi:hypothetical protein
LRIAVPWLGEAVTANERSDSHIRLPAAEWLFARGRLGATGRPWREWLLEGTSLGPGTLGRFPAGPCTYAASTGDRPRGTWARAEPVHLIAALDHLELAAPAPLPLERDESAMLRESLDEILQGTGYRLHPVGERAWLCECPAGLECTAAEPREAIGRDLRQWLPGGRDARQVQARVNELQMVLHEHPVNEQRAARGFPAVNSVWLWGFGVAGEASGAPAAALVTDDDWLAGVWQLHGGRAWGVAEFGELISNASPSLCVGLAVAPEQGQETAALERIEQFVFAPARKALERGALRGLSLLAGGVTVDVAARDRWRRWRAARPLREVLS